MHNGYQEAVDDGEGIADEIAEIIATRKQQAIDFYRKHNPDMKMRDIESHIAGIDFTQTVEIVKVPTGQELFQYTKRNTEGTILRGDYYTDNPQNTPSDLGISDTYNVRDSSNGWKQTQEVREVVKERITIPKDAEGLKSTSAEINDTWSRMDEYGNPLPIHTKGGGSQIYIPKNQF
ncbi:polymorphic toxin type 46 domain-containing protein [Capnocytophaga cynodegmi]|uniref:polymorphic toxin type 46 domain-containing protein n=1 Tax=Capnocytophaga cynodegmi TaxID=28189 RepID=UPI00385C8AD2